MNKSISSYAPYTLPGLLPDILGLIATCLDLVSVSHFLAACPALWQHRVAVWYAYWQSPRCLQYCRGLCDKAHLSGPQNPETVVVIAFDTEHQVDDSLTDLHTAHRAQCIWPHQRHRVCWVYCSPDCLDTTNLAGIVDVYNGECLDTVKREAEYRNNDYWFACTRSFAMPAWPHRHVVKNKPYNW